MPLPRFRIRTLMIAVAVVGLLLAGALCLENVGLGDAAELAGLVCGAVALGILPGLVLWRSGSPANR